MLLNVINLAKDLVKIINKNQFTRLYDRELTFEKDVYRIIREYLDKILNVNSEGLDKIVITHGETKEEKQRWSDTKVWQDVIIAGCRNTADIVVRLSDKETIAIQLKYTKGSITSAIQTVIGQCIITSLRFPVVIGIVFSKNTIKHHPEDRLTHLTDLLKEKNIFIIVKQM